MSHALLSRRSALTTWSLWSRRKFAEALWATAQAPKPSGITDADFFGDRVGMRGDIRYFRGLQNDDDGGRDLDLKDFSFWRGAIGVTFRFGG